MPSQISLRRLHEIIQVLAEWEDHHQHEFDVAGRRYGEPAPQEVIPVLNEVLVRLHALPLATGTFFSYVYDFGAHWETEVKVEKITSPDPRVLYPLVLGGGRAFPPEDSGGPARYQALLAALADPGQPQRETYHTSIGEAFEPERFDLEETNRRLQLLQ